MKEVAESLVETLATLVAEGIRRRGFHFVSPDETNLLGTDDVGKATCLRRLQACAGEHHWRVISLDHGQVLFQPLKQPPSTAATDRASRIEFQVLHAGKSRGDRRPNGDSIPD